ncbi:nuclear transport factor 2 family protein [Rhizorhabdus argentea]|uniref:nuclear transport factor 2 family protein n=1 Tax=Rhizorhabdus argentea TaxID=1387174 RepID=UPI0030EE6EE0
MSDIEHRLAELEARFAITDVVHKFCRAADRSDLEAIPPLFHDDAVDNHGFYEGDVPGLVEWMRERHRNILHASHNVTNILIEFAGTARALVESRVSVCIRYSAAGAAAFAQAAGVAISGNRPVDVLSFGRYIDIFEQRDSTWKIASRTTVPDQNLFFEVPEGTDISSPVLVKPRRDQEDLVFTLRHDLGLSWP